MRFRQSESTEGREKEQRPPCQGFRGGDPCARLDCVERVVVALVPGVRVHLFRVLPGLVRRRGTTGKVREGGGRSGDSREERREGAARSVFTDLSCEASRRAVAVERERLLGFPPDGRRGEWGRASTRIEAAAIALRTRLREHPVVEEHVAPLVVAENPLLLVLLDGIVVLLAHLELRASPLRDLRQTSTGRRNDSHGS